MSAFIELMATGGGTVFLLDSDIVGVRAAGDADSLAGPKNPIKVMMRGSPREVEVFGVSPSELLFKLYVARAEYLDLKAAGKSVVFKTYYLDGHAS